MTNYIPAEKLKRSVESIGLTPQKSADYNDGRDDVKMMVLDIIDSLQQKQQMSSLLVPIWCLENIQNTLRIQHNINSAKVTGETCQDRNIKESLNELQKILNGEELTGMERLEPLKEEQPEVDLEKEIDREWKKCNPVDEGMGVESAYMHIEAFDIIARHFAKWGAKHLKK